MNFLIFRDFFKKIFKFTQLFWIYSDFNDKKIKFLWRNMATYVVVDETRPPGCQFQAVSRQKLFQTYQF